MCKHDSENERILRSGCKLNLYLEITGHLPNGYHSLKTFMLPLLPVEPPFDTLRIKHYWRNGLTPALNITSNAPYLDPLNNTLQKAYALYAAQAEAVPDLEIYLEKGIPNGAGLGGGSADAATLLLFLES
ncbi:MAG: 4-diphosphocytidyl-2C-methyl-D-erythritol kinase, partial [Deltaproteobacteria bacterium]|nr:4-diphosphocytidyl-2C-methyl-D-erythritol kinase [Deltaproteobacteria bacterium]